MLVEVLGIPGVQVLAAWLSMTPCPQKRIIGFYKSLMIVVGFLLKVCRRTAAIKGSKEREPQKEPRVVLVKVDGCVADPL